MKIILAILPLIVGCAPLSMTGEIGSCPHAAVTSEMDGLLSGITVAPTRTIDEICGEGYPGCVSEDYHVYVDRGMSVLERRQIIKHEVCHVYEVSVLGHSWEHTSLHTGWRR